MVKCAFRSIFLPQIRGLPIDKALIQTELSPKKAARIIREVLRDTQLRAERTFNLDPHKLYIGAYNKYMYYVCVYVVRGRVSLAGIDKCTICPTPFHPRPSL